MLIFDAHNHMMKKIIPAVLTATLLFGCAGKKAEKKALRDSLMQIHEKVMAIDEKATNNHMKLDTLLKQGTLTNKDSATMLSKNLSTAEDAMESWMSHYEEKKGWSDDEAITYLRAQRKLMLSIDSQLNKAVNESSLYLNKVKK